MKKNLNYEDNVLQAFADNYSIKQIPVFVFGKRRHAREDGILTDTKNNIFSAELTKITNQSIEKRNSHLINLRGVGEPYAAYSSNEAIRAIDKKIAKYNDQDNRILILDANCCIPFDWTDYWQKTIEYGQKTNLAGIYAIQTTSKGVKIMTIKE